MELELQPLLFSNLDESGLTMNPLLLELNVCIVLPRRMATGVEDAVADELLPLLLLGAPVSTPPLIILIKDCRKGQQ